VLALAIRFSRPLETLGLRGPHGWPFGVAMGLALGYGILIVLQGRALASRPDALARLRNKLEAVRPILPHTSREFGLFIALAITAGICEELLFRGYMVWVLRPWIGLWGAAVTSMVLFGLGHSYQGVKYGVRAFYAGVAMGLIALATGSILPGMLLHALIDLGSGWISYLALRSGGGAPQASAEVA
jgi:hypothetical protein